MPSLFTTFVSMGEKFSRRNNRMEVFRIGASIIDFD